MFRDNRQKELVDPALSFGGMMLIGGWALLGFDPVLVEEGERTGRCAPQ
jgi:hypothetical protein